MKRIEKFYNLILTSNITLILVLMFLVVTKTISISDRNDNLRDLETAKSFINYKRYDIKAKLSKIRSEEEISTLNIDADFNKITKAIKQIKKSNTNNTVIKLTDELLLTNKLLKSLDQSIIGHFLNKNTSEVEKVLKSKEYSQAETRYYNLYYKLEKQIHFDYFNEVEKLEKEMMIIIVLIISSFAVLILTIFVKLKRIKELKTEVKKQEKEKQLRILKLALIGEVSSGIAHDVANPLTVITGYLNLIQKKINDSDNQCKIQKQYLKKIDDSNRLARDIISNFSDIIKSGSNDNFKRISLYEIITKVETFSAKRMELAGIKEIQTDNMKDTYFYAREGILKQVLINLINNSSDAISDLENQDERWIKINLKQENYNAVISIIDSGPGINEKFHENIFEPLFTTKEKSKGTGLGLSISKKLLNQMGASISYNSNSINTCFEIKIDQRIVSNELTETTVD